MVDIGFAPTDAQPHVSGYSHPVGTCKMGPASDPAAVVDASGRVHSLRNLYVADASIIPHIPHANTNLTCMLVGLKVAGGIDNDIALT